MGFRTTKAFDIGYSGNELSAQLFLHEISK